MVSRRGFIAVSSSVVMLFVVMDSAFIESNNFASFALITPLKISRTLLGDLSWVLTMFSKRNGTRMTELLNLILLLDDVGRVGTSMIDGASRMALKLGASVLLEDL